MMQASTSWCGHPREEDSSPTGPGPPWEGVEVTILLPLVGSSSYISPALFFWAYSALQETRFEVHEVPI